MSRKINGLPSYAPAYITPEGTRGVIYDHRSYPTPEAARDAAREWLFERGHTVTPEIEPDDPQTV